MTISSPGKMFLADQRGLTQTESLRRLSTFNYDTYQNEHKQPIDVLYAFNDEILLGLQSITTTVAQASYIIIIPITGALNFTNAQGNTSKADAGEVLIVNAAADSSFSIANAYDGDWINYLQVHIAAEQFLNATSIQSFNFDLDAAAGRLLKVVSASDDEVPLSVSIGRFGGREEAIYPLANGSKLFAFAIAGAFEMQGRLLHERDGLALWDTNEADIEALSNNALMLIIELPSAQ